jgi:Importin beta binding domain/Armadillo/beta-catenin-like repeat
MSTAATKNENVRTSGRKRNDTSQRMSDDAARSDAARCVAVVVAVVAGEMRAARASSFVTLCVFFHEPLDRMQQARAMGFVVMSFDVPSAPRVISLRFVAAARPSKSPVFRFRGRLSFVIESSSLAHLFFIASSCPSFFCFTCQCHALQRRGFKKTVDLEESRRGREETSIQIRKTKKEARMAKRRQMPTGGLSVPGGPDSSGPTPAGLAAASMLLNSGDPTYSQMMEDAAVLMGGAGGGSNQNQNDANMMMMAGSGSGATGGGNVAVAAKLEQLPAMVAGVMGNDPAVQTECTTHFRRLLSIEKNPPIQQVIESGVVPRFVEFLQRDDNPALQFEAAWALTNIASGTSEHTKVVIEMDAIPIFVKLLGSPNDDVREQAVWALGNIAGDSPPCRDLVLQHGAMQPLLMQLHQNSKLTMLRNATWTLSNFCRGKPQPDFELVRPALPTLAQLIFSPDEEVLTDACWALSYLSDGPNEKIQAVIEAGVCRRLVELLLNPSPAVQTYVHDTKEVV